MNILIIGGGVGGLALAGLIDDQKHNVAILEKNAPELQARRGQWFDHINLSQLIKLGLGDLLPPETLLASEAPERTLAGPSRKFKLRFKIGAPAYAPVWRPDLLAALRTRAAAKAQIRYDTRVNAILIEGERVTGVTLTDGREIRADLVVDASGLGGLSRPLLADLYCRDEDFLTLWRADFPADDSFSPGDNFDVRPTNGGVLTRFSRNAAGRVDLLLGQHGAMEPGFVKRALADALRTHCADAPPEIDEHDGDFYILPTRAPSLQMVFNGCAMLGDSAYMTHPLTGAGIVQTLHAAKILAEVLSEIDTADADALWRYQLRYYKQCAQNSFRLDTIRRFIVDAPDEVLDQILEARVFTESDMRRIFMGRFLSLAPQHLLIKGAQLLFHPRVLAEVVDCLAHALWAQECARGIPEHYDVKKVAAWQQRTLRGIGSL
ncbi:MAG: FAD-dependent monooxygenase [Oscillospiraceae bacterium]|jgi:2-polyprenyl-6-methoxyphenol hydroxylase-like FAD-dependent oxidoreductase|nr:FAD-dependent monooxygenase [Oscillospiraceae bacterium]